MRTHLLAAAAAVTAISLAGAATASADSIVYTKDHNVWLANPDGSGQFQVTTDGTEGVPYLHPSQADDGTIAVGHGSDVVRLAQNGEVLSSFNPPAGTDSTNTVNDAVVQDIAVSPDGKRVAFVYYRYGCPIGADCGARQSLLYSDADAETPKATYGQQFNMTNPSWISNDRLIMFGGYGQQVNFDSPGGGDDDRTHWFDDDEHLDISDGELSPQQDRFAAIRDYGSNARLQIWSVSNLSDAPQRACQTGANESLSGPSWSPDGKSLAFTGSDGIEVLPLPTVVAGDCPAASSSATVIPGGSDPDWGPADVNPQPRFEANYDEAKLGKALKKGLRFHVNGSHAGSATVALTRAGKKVATGSGQVTAGADSTLTARFSKKAKKALAKKRSVKLAIKVVYKPAGSAQQVATGALKLKR